MMELWRINTFFIFGHCHSLDVENIRKFFIEKSFEVISCEKFGTLKDLQFKNDIKNARKIVLYVQQHEKHGWDEFVNIMSEKKTSEVNGENCIRYLVDSEDDLPSFMLGKTISTHDLPSIIDFFNDSTNLEHFIYHGNVGIGLAWGYFYGFLNFIIPEISKISEKLEKELNDGVSVPSKLFIFVPESGVFPDTFPIEFDEMKTPPINRPRAANKCRPYDITFGKILHDEKKYFIVLDKANPVTSIRGMSSKNESGCVMKLDDEKIVQEIKAFRNKLKEILCCDHAYHCHNRFEIIFYSEKKDNDGEISYEVLQNGEYFPLKDFIVEKIDETDDNLVNSPAGVETDTRPKVNLMIPDEDVNSEFIKQLILQLNRYDIDVHQPEFRIGKNRNMEMIHNIQNCDKLIFYHSDDKETDKEREFKESTAIANAVDNNNIKAKKLVKSKENPHDFLENIVIDDQLEYLDKLIDFCKAPNETLSCVPSHKVGIGMAWSFFYGYLKRMLPDFPNAFANMEKDIKCKTSKKYLIFIPFSRDSCHELGAEFTHIKRVEITQSNHGRTYTVPFYSVKSRSHLEYYFFGEYATPIEVLFEMEKLGFAGLTAIKRREEVQIFKKTLEELILYGLESFPCHIICYDGRMPAFSLSEYVCQDIPKIL